jgi:hypothetical protein
MSVMRLYSRHGVFARTKIRSRISTAAMTACAHPWAQESAPCESTISKDPIEPAFCRG